MDFSFLTLNTEETSALFLSIKVAFWCSVVTFIPGVFCGWLLARKNFFGKTIFDVLVHLPLVLPPIVSGYILLLFFGNQGFLGKFLNDFFGFSVAFNWKGAVLASAVIGFPLMVRSVRLSIELVEKRLEEAAFTLGASKIRVFFTVTLPLAFSGILTGLILSFARSLGEFGATITFVSNIEGETRTLPLALFTYLQFPNGEASALRIVILSVILSCGSLVASEIIAKRIRNN
ncbi:molybdate ABC transporter permease subunit [bacterium]|nr:molybdate ABC transporter permease subunit [bacterium]